MRFDWQIEIAAIGFLCLEYHLQKNRLRYSGLVHHCRSWSLNGGTSLEPLSNTFANFRRPLPVSSSARFIFVSTDYAIIKKNFCNPLLEG